MSDVTPEQAANTIREALELSRDLPCGVPEARLADLRRLDSMYGPALAALKVLEDAANDHIAVSSADEWLQHLYYRACDDRDAAIRALGEPCAECGHIDWRSESESA